MNHLLCEGGNEDNNSDYNEVEKPCSVPLLYDYTHGTIVANCSIPKGGQPFYRYRFEVKKTYDVELKKFKVKHAANGVQVADKSFFQ